ncbi:MAG: membrane protein insertion efficiency factor YidD [Candidatus Omnitrophica bacterium]|nr:membrane protein insertion efficiency factor YidD [Candidatus Omnitrophota bacterium]
MLNAARRAILLPINIYRKYFSPFKLQCCRFHPSCSEYACLAVEKYGVMKGLVKSIWRILRCNPFSPGGYDPA